MKNKIFSITVALIVLLATTSNVLADEINKGLFAAFIFTPNTANGTMDGYELASASMLGFYSGDKKKLGDHFGVYSGLDMTYHTVDETITSTETLYVYANINAGLTYGLTEQLTLLGGLGLSLQEGQYIYYGTKYESDEMKKALNLQAGIMYEFMDRFGALVKYDSASESLGGGITLKF